MDCDLNLNSHIKTKSAFCHRKNISRKESFMSQLDLKKKKVNEFILSKLDYCDGVFTGLPKKSIRQLQLIQNAAAQVLTNTNKVDHITPVLRSFQKLPVSRE